MRVLVTGGTSLLGAHVARLLAARGDRVTCFQRRPSNLGLTDVLGDLRDREAVLAAARDHEAVVHIAALVAPRPRYASAYAVNVTGTANVLEAATRCGRLLHVSTPSVAFRNVPTIGAAAQAATYDGNDAYTLTKVLAEKLVLEHSAVPTVVLRPHLIWGPGDTQLVGRILDRARRGHLAIPDGGRAMVDTTYIDDAAEAVVAGLDCCVDAHPALGRPWVVTGGDPRPLGELVEGILRAAGLAPRYKSIPAPLAGVVGRFIGTVWLGAEPPLTYFATRQLSVAHWFDLRETREVLRWTPRVGVEEGLLQLRASLRP